ncbi:sensor histidine kinase [Planotetraspora kaengkrachanensis]|uniref:histidine kinase n=1 Tax=Planotetraspora kaengkrachanensis TaxID=575193 RepID=A0A8J3Q1H1_9ACTN|nr:HAMP domain-containing sensor histidine kinase [Planotetraspora kaengkrachanensis]GIG84786.1 hypothetical protein Pka01_79130 [Planotetraspora kaengkrachanensis]
MTTLRGRLLAGLIGVTALGLAALSLVSMLMLRSHMIQRMDASLLTAANASATRLARASGIAVVQAGSTYAVVTLNASTGRARLVGGDDPDAAALPGLVQSVGAGRLGAHADAGETFTMGSRLRAAAARMAAGDRVVVVAVPLDEIRNTLARLLVTELVTGGVLIGLLALFGRWLIRGGLAPLARMADTAQRVAAGGDLSTRMPEGPTEAGRLGRAINVMLAQIQQAFAARWASEERLRRFAADASHELRTPLTTIHGYAELYRKGAIPDEDVPQVMLRIENESARITRLVTELLELARLDRGAALSVALVDLVPVVAEVVDDFTALNPDHPVRVESPPALEREVDEARIRQVLVNLLGNVAAHTPPGTSVLVRLAPPGVLQVADDGPGMPEGDAARAFDRFHGAGSGLGLAIVQAIAAAHGGTVTLSSTLGQGTVVTVDLGPRADARSPAGPAEPVTTPLAGPPAGSA